MNKYKQPDTYYTGIWVIMNNENWKPPSYYSVEHGWVDNVKAADMFDKITGKLMMESIPAVHGSYGQELSYHELTMSGAEVERLEQRLRNAITE